MGGVGLGAGAEGGEGRVVVSVGAKHPTVSVSRTVAMPLSQSFLRVSITGFLVKSAIAYFTSTTLLLPLSKMLTVYQSLHKLLRFGLGAFRHLVKSVTKRYFVESQVAS